MRVKLWGPRASAPRRSARGPTPGFRIAEGDASLCYLPDHAPALAGPPAQLDPAWLSGYGLAREADLLLHDCRYTDAEYPSHFGWGHSSLSDARARWGAAGGAPVAIEMAAELRESDVSCQRSSIRAMSSSAPAFASGSLRLPHFGDCTHDVQPASQGHSAISRWASATRRSKRRKPWRVMPTPPGWPS